MKNIMLLSTGIMLFCIVPISNTQAMPCRAPGEISFAFNPPHPGLSVFNQKKPHDMSMELRSPVFKENAITYDNYLHGTTLARNGRAIEEHPNADIRRRPVRREDGDGAVYVDDDDDDAVDNDNNWSDDGDDGAIDNNNNGNGGGGDGAVDNNNNGNNGGEDDNYFVNPHDEIL